MSLTNFIQHQRSKKDVGIKFGLLGASMTTGNMGVSALAASVVGLILNHRPNADISLFMGNRSRAPQLVDLVNRQMSLRIINYRLSPRSALQEHLFWIFFLAFLWRILPFRYFRQKIVRSNEWIRKMLELDYVGDICGGDSFSDIYGIRRYLINITPAIVSLILRKPLTLLPQTYGPFRRKWAASLARIILANAEWVFCRDRHSMMVAKKLRGHSANDNVRFCPDVAFSLPVSPVNWKWISPKIDALVHNTLVGINVSGLLYNGGYSGKNMFGLRFNYQDFIRALVSKIMDGGRSVILIPHNFGPIGDINNDLDSCRKVKNSFVADTAESIYIIKNELNQSQLKAVIGRCSLFIGSRMHSCIAALSQGIPAIGIAYSRKFAGIYDSLGLADLTIDATATSKEQVFDRINTIQNRVAQYKDRLLPAIIEAKQRLNDVFEEFLCG